MGAAVTVGVNVATRVADGVVLPEAVGLPLPVGVALSAVGVTEGGSVVTVAVLVGVAAEPSVKTNATRSATERRPSPFTSASGHSSGWNNNATRPPVLSSWRSPHSTSNPMSRLGRLHTRSIASHHPRPFCPLEPKYLIDSPFDSDAAPPRKTQLSNRIAGQRCQPAHLLVGSSSGLCRPSSKVSGLKCAVEGKSPMARPLPRTARRDDPESGSERNSSSERTPLPWKGSRGHSHDLVARNSLCRRRSNLATWHPGNTGQRY